MAAAIKRDLPTIFDRAALGCDVDNAGRAQTILRGKGACPQIKPLNEAWRECLAERSHAFR